MKIKDVARQTGLTEKTIRYYEEKLLITPEKEIINGREFRSYSEEDVKNLLLAANLRKLDFSIAEIIKMRDRPECIPEVFREYCLKIKGEIDSKTDIVNMLEQMDYSTIAGIEDLAGQLEEMSANRPLPAADIEFEFHKMDGLTRDELQKEVLGYQERMLQKTRIRIRNLKLLFVFSQILFAAFSGLTIYTLNFLGYIPGYHNNTAWIIILIPVFALLLTAVIFIFVKVIRHIAGFNDESKLQPAITICKYAILVLVLCSVTGTVIQVQGLKSMQNLKNQTGSVVEAEWYAIYRMTDLVDQYLSQPDNQDGIRFTLYVNQTCYHFAYNFYVGNLQTKLRDILINCYDPAFYEIAGSTDGQSKADTVRMLKGLNSELKAICTEVLDMSIDEKADLVRYDNPKTVELRTRINNLADKYCVGQWRLP